MGMSNHYLIHPNHPQNSHQLLGSTGRPRIHKQAIHPEGGGPPERTPAKGARHTDYKNRTLLFDVNHGCYPGTSLTTKSLIH
jgi:hypothetical protein